MPGERMKPIRVLLEKGGQRFGGPITFPADSLPPGPGKDFDERHVVVDAKAGVSDDTWDEVILTIKEK